MRVACVSAHMTKQLPSCAAGLVRVAIRGFAGSRSSCGAVALIAIAGLVLNTLYAPEVIPQRDRPRSRLRSPRLSRALARGLTVLDEHSPVATLVTSDDGTIDYGSPGSDQVFGHTAKELTGLALVALAHPDDRQQLADLLCWVAAVPDRTADGTFRFPTSDGSVRRLHGNVTNRLHVAGIRALVTHWWHATARAAKPDAIELAEDEFRILINNALHVTAILEPNGLIRYISPAVERMLGYPPQRLIGSHFSALIHPDDAPEVWRALSASGRHTAAGRLIEFRGLHQNGSTRVLEAIASNRVDNLVIGGIVVDARDVTERTWSAERLQRSLDALLAIHDVGRLLGSRLEQREIGAALLAGATRIAPIEGATLVLRTARGALRVAQIVGEPSAWHACRNSRAARLARQEVLRSASLKVFQSGTSALATGRAVAVALPLRVHDRVVGILEVYGRAPIDAWPMDELGTLADQAASALERARLYEALTEREHRLEQIVRQLLLTQEEERRRVAYEIHDGLAQLAAATQQHLEAFATHYHTLQTERADELRLARLLASRTVQEARRTISGLRPTVLDDFGLTSAIRFELQGLRGEGWRVDYTDTLGPARLEAVLETALFRIFQETVANIRKHAGTTRIAVSLERRGQSVRLAVRDWGCGFQPDAVRSLNGPSERVGLAGIQERIALLDGRCTIRSRPGAGARVIVEAPLREALAASDA